MNNLEIRDAQVIAVLLGLIYLQLKYDQSGIQNINGKQLLNHLIQ